MVTEYFLPWSRILNKDFFVYPVKFAKYLAVLREIQLFSFMHATIRISRLKV